MFDAKLGVNPNEAEKGAEVSRGCGSLSFSRPQPLKERKTNKLARNQSIVRCKIII
jgi:hypothetical protein